MLRAAAAPGVIVIDMTRMPKTEPRYGLSLISHHH